MDRAGKMQQDAQPDRSALRTGVGAAPDLTGLTGLPDLSGLSGSKGTTG
jgi:hypothetical protein